MRKLTFLFEASGLGKTSSVNSILSALHLFGSAEKKMTQSRFFSLVCAASILNSVDSFRGSYIPLRSWIKTEATRTPQTPQKQLHDKKDVVKINVIKDFTSTAQEQIKRYFIYCATQIGIPWKEYYDLGATNMNVLLDNYMKINEPTIVYPEYFTQPFHSYPEGNLNWEASLEVIAATISISAAYWPLADVVDAESWMRGNTTSAIQKHILNHKSSKSVDTGRIMDIGCSVGASTKFLIEAFPEKDRVDAVDLSPYFLAAAMFYNMKPDSPIYTALNKKIAYHHMLAEDLSFPSNSYDIVSISYLLHEVPTKTAEAVIAEAFRVLRPGGVVSIVDLSGKKIRNLLQPQKAFFELTEPHILQYYKTDPIKILADAGFTFIETKRNDPMNVLWIATKPHARNFRMPEVIIERIPDAHDARVKATAHLHGLLNILLASIKAFFISL